MKNRILRVLFLALIAFIFGGLGTIVVNKYLQDSENTDLPVERTDYNLVRYRLPENISNPEVNSSFINASSKSCPTVVFVKAITEGYQYSYNFWDLFFDYFLPKKTGA